MTLSVRLAVLLITLVAAPAAAQVRHVAEMTGDEIARLERATTVALLPGGILEQHGPTLHHGQPRPREHASAQMDCGKHAIGRAATSLAITTHLETLL